MERIDFAQSIYESLGVWTYVAIPLIIGILSSLVSEVIYKNTPPSSWTKKHNIIFAVNLLASIAVMMMFHRFYSTWTERGGSFLANYGVSICIYYFFGKNLIDKLIKRGNKEIDERLD